MLWTAWLAAPQVSPLYLFPQHEFRTLGGEARLGGQIRPPSPPSASEDRVSPDNGIETEHCYEMGEQAMLKDEGDPVSIAPSNSEFPVRK